MTVISAGTNTSVTAVESVRPPITAIASGFCSSAPDPNPTSSWANGPDPVLDATVPLWTAAFVQYAGSELGYKTDMTYRLLNRDARSKWDFGTSPTRQGYAGVIDQVQEARSANPSRKPSQKPGAAMHKWIAAIALLGAAVSAEGKQAPARFDWFEYRERDYIAELTESPPA